MASIIRIVYNAREEGRMSKQQRFALAIGVGAILMLGGIFIITHFDLARPNAGQHVVSGNIPIITEITVGTPLNAEEAKRPDPKLRQATAYEINQPLALRIKLNPQIQEPVQVGVRLLTEQGTIVELDPSKVTLAPGTTTYCCWQVDRPDTYLMQIFRPEKTITSIPLIIRPGFGAAPIL